jgi:hypothetical protein
VKHRPSREQACGENRKTYEIHNSRRNKGGALYAEGAHQTLHLACAAEADLSYLNLVQALAASYNIHNHHSTTPPLHHSSLRTMAQTHRIGFHLLPPVAGSCSLLQDRWGPLNTGQIGQESVKHHFQVSRFT